MRNAGSGSIAYNSRPSLLHRSLREKPLLARSASGHKIILEDGSEILDACGGAAVAIIGHGNQEVISAIAEQAQSISYVHTGTYTTSAAEQLADLLVGHKPYGLSKAFFVGSGSEAVDGAMKLARQYFYERGEVQRKHFISRRQGYHGNTFGSMSISSNLSRLEPYRDILLPYVSHVSPCYQYQYQTSDETTDGYVARLAMELDAEFQRVGSDSVIAFVAETVVGATSGCVPPVPGYLAAMQAVCKKHGALLVLDEIMCGMGRTGTLFAWEQEKNAAGEPVVPDIMTIGKGLGGGYVPISGLLIHEKVVTVLEEGSGSFNHGHTFQAHPISCAAALAVQKVVQRQKLVEHCARMGNVLGGYLWEYLGNEDYVGDIRGRGLFYAVEFVQDKIEKKSFDPKVQFGLVVQKQAHKLGVAIYPGMGTVDGSKGDHILIAPPFTVQEKEIREIVLAVTKAYRIAVALVRGAL
ncbi:pyridoxal phosphate-dependent transferase [Aspergillus alliaceus]|uniref:pyridoxal phosphate-dependent transferase n=1 Tax=Petromyces alliaceus TaxID=209559 RepID=UPI0012A3EFA1|nr:pyridoxal phosphate-dependent transferase [Aspergillus alliaceus]KAB8229536.1 pyridoxal phosphate-dependent transferase [Aspergillus alliaceus]